MTSETTAAGGPVSGAARDSTAPGSTALGSTALGSTARDRTARDSRYRRVNSSVAEGLANGFAEASLAFSEEVQGGSSYTDVFESVAAGLLRANGRFLDELGTAVRRASDDLADQRSEPSAFGARQGTIDQGAIDYARLADLIAARLAATEPVASIDYERLADLVASRLAGRGAGQGGTGQGGTGQGGTGPAAP